MRARVDPVYSEILNSADISIPDGIGLIAAHKFLQLPTTDNLLLKPLLYFAQGLGVGFSVLFDRDWLQDDIRAIRGRELFLELIKLANKKKWRVVLVGDRKESARKALNKLLLNYKQIGLFAYDGPNLDEDANPKTKADHEIEKKTIEKINRISPQLLFVGFGAPRQEKWLHKCWKDLEVGGAMVVGGTFDYISGKVKLPPKWLADMGLEWLWRLFTGSQTTDRVLKAFPAFALKVYWYKLTGF
jgi:N-acetylglucosaminyldiphosphoundecaprenol N-acetyl-beta-D-mannosaminyltransferase